jgi:hypothetical protein
VRTARERRRAQARAVAAVSIAPRPAGHGPAGALADDGAAHAASDAAALAGATAVLERLRGAAPATAQHVFETHFAALTRAQVEAIAPLPGRNPDWIPIADDDGWTRETPQTRRSLERLALQLEEGEQYARQLKLN